MRFVTQAMKGPTGLLKVRLTPGFLPPGQRPFHEQVRIQPGSASPNVPADASGDRPAQPSARSPSATVPATPTGAGRGRSFGNTAKNDSIAALSPATPTLPIDPMCL